MCRSSLFFFNFSSSLKSKHKIVMLSSCKDRHRKAHCFARLDLGSWHILFFSSALSWHDQPDCDRLTTFYLAQMRKLRNLHGHLS